MPLYKRERLSAAWCDRCAVLVICRSFARLSFVENDCVTIDDYVVFGSEVMMYTDTQAPWVPEEYNKKLQKSRGHVNCLHPHLHASGTRSCVISEDFCDDMRTSTSAKPPMCWTIARFYRE